MAVASTTAPVPLSQEHLASLGIESTSWGEIEANKQNLQKLLRLPIKRLGGTCFPGVVEATPDALKQAIDLAEYIVNRDVDTMIMANPGTAKRPEASFDVTDFSESVTFYLGD